MTTPAERQEGKWKIGSEEERNRIAFERFPEEQEVEERSPDQSEHCPEPGLRQKR